MSDKFGMPMVESTADEIARLRAEYAEDCGRLLQTIKYLTGIASKGEGREPAEDETVEQFVLGYVKRLEAELAEAKRVRDNCTLVPTAKLREMQAELAAIKEQEPSWWEVKFRRESPSFDALCVRSKEQAYKEVAPHMIESITPLYALPVADKDAERWRELLISCRGSVKSDLYNYEQMLLGRTTEAQYSVVDAECDRLHKLLDQIDAAMAKGE